MKILYLSTYELNIQSGVTHKIMSQLQNWVKEGNDVIYISLSTLSIYSVKGHKKSEDLILRKNNKINLLINQYTSSIKLKALLRDIDFDLVYMRYNTYDPFFKAALKNTPLIVEMNSNDITEAKLRSKLGYYYNKIFRKYFLNIATAFICVSNEIQKDTLKKDALSKVIANGIDTSMFTYKEHKALDRPSLAFIGTPGSVWHGVDKIVQLSKSLPNFDFHIIGEAGNNTDNLYYHGYLALDKTIDILEQCDIGICTMALHRKNMNEASPLKSRQYLAMGLPIIYAYEDTDITASYPFVLKLPNEENNVLDNIKLIEKYVLDIVGKEEIRLMARNFALSTLDAGIKEKVRVDFFSKVLNLHSSVT